MIIKQALERYATSKPTAFSHDRMQTLGASEVGQCARKIWYIKNETDPQLRIARDADHVDGWGARMRGKVYEDEFWVPAMRAKFGNRLLYAGGAQSTFINGFLSATPDGLVIDLTEEEKAGLRLTRDFTGDCVLLECKTVDPRTNLTEAKDANVFQTQVQMGLVRELTPYKPTHSIISYTDASWWNDVKEFVVEFDPKLYANAHARATQVMTAKAAHELKPEGYIAGGNECRYCAFTGPCGIERRNLPFANETNVDPQFAAEIRDMALGLKEYERERDYQDEQVREMQEQIKNRLREKGVRKIPGVVSWSGVKGREKVDTKALMEAAAAAGIEVEQYVTEGTPGDRLTISVTKPGDSVA